MTRAALSAIKNDLELHVGQKVKIRAMKGRKQMLEKEGVLENTYPNIFVIRVEEPTSVRRLSYSYTDILTDSVELFLESHEGCKYKPFNQAK
ncbi:MAG: Veg family protein [Bacillota bacterium]